jgi:hypothetical protein
MPRLLLALLCVLLISCAPTLGDDDDASSDDDDVTGDDDDTSGDDDDTIADDDDVSGDDDDDDTSGDDDDTGCGVDDLVLGMQVLDANGVSGVSFRPTDELTLSGSLENVCDIMLTFETNSGCLLEPWSLSGDGNGLGRGCDDAITVWSVAEAGTLYDVVEVGALAAGTWMWEVGFGGTIQTLTFTVQ